MVNLTIDGKKVEVEEGTTVLKAAEELGIRIPTLCYFKALAPESACRLCVVEIVGGARRGLSTSCSYVVEEGLEVRTATKRVVAAREMILELLISQCPTAKVLQDMAAKMGLKQVRFKPKWESCVYCGLCVRMCEEQMMAKAIGFMNRGNELKVATPFDNSSEECRRCGACMYVCPACTLRCEGPEPEHVLCGRCENSMQPTCLEVYDNFTCWMGLKGDCGTCVQETKDGA